MNVLKNFEALFIVALGLACAANYVLDGAPNVTAPAYASAAPMHVVVVSAKRLSAEEKLQSLRDENKAASASSATGAVSAI